jgi:DNA-binding response OmpR family regulator
MKMSGDPRVLIIENNEALRVLLFTILRHQPVGVDTAQSVDEALRKVTTCDYALVLVDLDMPDKAGVAFLEQFREERPEATTFVIAVRSPQSEVFLDPAVVSVVLHKPLEIDTLSDIVRECAPLVPAPEKPLPCPPAESDIRTRLERGSYIAN